MQVFDQLDQKISLKQAWRRLQLLARTLIVGTFIDDAIRIASDYTGQADSMRTVGFGDPASAILPAIYVVVQATGALLVLRSRPTSSEAGCVALIVWAGAHPFLYSQQDNVEFVVESVSIIGGLLILLSSMRALRRVRVPDEDERTDRLQLAGRACLSALYIYYVQKMARERLAALISGGSTEAPGVALTEGVLLVLLGALTALLVVGMRSRWCALALALATAGAALFKHPWYLVRWWDEEETYRLDEVVGYEGTRVPAWVYATHQRYFFFQQLSTAGALLTLVVHGPGKYSVDEADGPLQVVTLTSKGTD